MEVDRILSEEILFNESASVGESELSELLEEARVVQCPLGQLLRKRGFSRRIEGVRVAKDCAGINLSGTSWIGCDLSGTGFQHATLKGVRFEHCKMEYSNFFSASLEDVEFVGIDLRHVQFVSADLLWVDFFECAFVATSFLHADVRESRLRECDLTHALLMGAGKHFLIESCVFQQESAPVVMTFWFHEDPAPFAMRAFQNLDAIGAIPLLADATLRLIDPEALRKQVEERLDQLGSTTSWSLAKRMVRDAPEESPIGQIASIAKELVSSVDAVLIPGGDDIEPEIYGEERSDEVWTSDDWRRTIFELSVIDAMREVQRTGSDKRLMGICRGAQMIAVYDGHKMIQDIPNWGGYQDHYLQPQEGETGAHEVALEILGREPIWVHCYHHQAVDPVEGGELEMMAEWNGIPKLWGSPDGKVLGVQFHPECYNLARNEGASQNQQANGNFFRWLTDQPLVAV